MRLLLLGLRGQALAAPVSVTWTGTVVPENLDEAPVGRTITGAFTFDITGVSPKVFAFPSTRSRPPWGS
ncbi:MAG: hypothetical protein ACFBSD_09200 [Paracoccaceae bacterium]